ncbi:MAG: methyltransferase domain-containing protein [Carbonactinosporaceae bacterium]
MMLPVNWIHRRLCRSQRWARRMERVAVPFALGDADLGGNVLEIGPGYGPTTRILARDVPGVTAVEVDPRLAARLGRVLSRDVAVVAGDGVALPFRSESFTAVVCFTMLHHVPSAALQDRLFAEACRVLRPGGIFAGSDSQPSLRFRAIHLFDTMVPVAPADLPARLEAAGLSAVSVERRGRVLRFSARKHG